MPAPLDLTGATFGRLTVIARSHREPGQSWKWECGCVCGRAVFVQGSLLKAGRTSACSSCAISASRTTHGESKTPLFRRWQAMLARTGNPNNSQWADYGGRGIAVCLRWRDYTNFADDMRAGFQPNLELDRIDVNGNYEPTNCRWISHAEQQLNKRSNHRVEWRGRTLTVQEWAALLELKPNTIIYRLRRGWATERALSTGANPTVLLEVANA